MHTLRWRHNGPDGQQPHDCLINRLFSRRSKETWRLRVTGLCEGNSPVTGEFPAQKASNAETFSIWWRHHARSEKYSNDVWPNLNSVFFVIGDLIFSHFVDCTHVNTQANWIEMNAYLCSTVNCSSINLRKILNKYSSFHCQDVRVAPLC